MQQSARGAYRRCRGSGNFARWVCIDSRPSPRSACVRSRSLAPANASAPMRIVSLAPSVTETLFALGAGPEVVGVSQYCDYPPQVRDLPRVGSFLTPNLEAIIALRPTLIVGLELSSDVRQIRALNSMGYPVLLVSDDSLDQIEASIEKVGARIDRDAEARRLVARIRAQIAAVQNRLAQRKAAARVDAGRSSADRRGRSRHLSRRAHAHRARRQHRADGRRTVAASQHGIHHRDASGSYPRRRDGLRSGVVE